MSAPWTPTKRVRTEAPSNDDALAQHFSTRPKFDYPPSLTPPAHQLATPFTPATPSRAAGLVAPVAELAEVDVALKTVLSKLADVKGALERQERVIEGLKKSKAFLQEKADKLERENGALLGKVKYVLPLLRLKRVLIMRQGYREQVEGDRDPR